MKKGSMVLAGLAVVWSIASTCFPAWGAPVPPDLTKGETNGVNRSSTYNLGPSGLRGWIYTRPAEYLDSVQGRTTAASRQILVTHVGANSPADGVMAVNDVILGVGDHPFADDARKSFGMAITEAEKTENKGILKLVRFRDGQTENVQLKLRVMGSYSDTAPYDCPKSKLILADACKRLEQEPLSDNLWGAINGLALLATGEAKYLPKVQAFARQLAAKKIRNDGGEDCDTWNWGYQCLFLSEYYLATGDKDVRAGIDDYALAIARGQGMYGTFGHGGAAKTPDGKFHGSVPPYGPVNQCGLSANLSLVVAKKCGVANPEIDPAIWRASQFFGYFVDKGTVPYGEHIAWNYHENNGKSSLAALLFGLQRGRTEEARYFAKMSTAAYANREYGHTGQGFSYLWGALGANVGGPAAAAAFVKQAQWHLDLVRRSDGSFTYDGGEQYGAGKTDDDTYYGRSSYYGLNPDASYILTYAMPLRKLYITGKDANKANWLSAAETAKAVASGRFDVDRKSKTPAELVAAFGDWSPVVRGWAAEELARRPEAQSMTPSLIAMAEGKEARARQGACEALGYIKNTNALPVLVRLLSHEDRWLRVKAANAIKNMGGASRAALPDMLKAVAATAEPLSPIVWDDPVQLGQGELAAALFKGGPLSQSVEGVDRALLYPAIRVISRNANGMARALLRNTFEQHLTVEDVQALAPDILAAVQMPSPADRMFANEIRMGGFKALTKYHFKEGIAAGVNFAKTQGGHGSEGRTGQIMKELIGYGSAAREALPELRELIEDFHTQVRNRKFPGGELNNRRVSAVEEAIKAIEAATDHPELRSIPK